MGHVRQTAADTGALLHEIRYERLQRDARHEAAALFRFLSLRDEDAKVDACLERASFARLSGRAVGSIDPHSPFRSATAGQMARAHARRPTAGLARWRGGDACFARLRAQVNRRWLVRGYALTHRSRATTLSSLNRDRWI